jgi:DNA topoisomerase-1
VGASAGQSSILPICLSDVLARSESGKDYAVDLRDRRVATIVKRCRDLPGQELFQYLDAAGDRHTIGSADVNAYLRGNMGEEFTAKDVRTWAGTVLAAQELRRCEPAASDSDARRNVAAAVQTVAAHLGNTPAICRRCYIHPAVIDAYLDGTLCDPNRDDDAMPAPDVSPDEALVLILLGRHAPAST